MNLTTRHRDMEKDRRMLPDIGQERDRRLVIDLSLCL
jgi:hypothetical protein